MPTTFTSCYSNVSGKCNIEWKEYCNTQGNQITLKFDQSVHHVTIGNHNNGSIDTSQYVDQSQMNANYLFQATQTSSNPIVWATYTVQWVCGQAVLSSVWDGSGDPQPWHQNCHNTTATLPYDTVYIYYKGGRAYNLSDIQTQYWGIMAWLQNQGWVDPVTGSYTSQAGSVYHTIIGGGGERWLDWATSAYTGMLNNAGTQHNWPGGPNHVNGDCDTTGWDEYGTGFAAGALGDVIDWSHNTSGVYNFYSSTNAGLTTSATSSGNTITSDGLPPTAGSTDRVLIIVLNDDSDCAYHGAKTTANAAINGVTYQGCIDFDGNCGTGGDIVNDGFRQAWKADHVSHLAALSTHIGGGGTHNGVNWPTMPMGDMSQPKDLSYILHVAASITSGNKTVPDGTFTAGCPKYHPTISNSMWDPAGLPSFNMPPGATADGYPCIRVLENSNPYVTASAGMLDQNGWTYPKLFGGSEFSIYASPGTITQPGLTGGTYVIPSFEIQLQETLEVDFSISSSGGVSCNPPIDCITVQAIDVNTINTTNTPVPNYDIDFGALGVQTTDANGYAFFNNITPGTYNLFDTAITTQGDCFEYLYEVYIGTCTFTPTEQCSCGCMDPNANNYDPNATCDDGSCNYDRFGCTDLMLVIMIHLLL